VGEGAQGQIKAVRLTDEQRIDWLRLIRSPSIGPRTFRSLINHFGGARAALEALPGLARRGGGAAPQIYSRAEAERELETADDLGVAFVALGEADYPARLQMIDDAPPLITLRGERGVLAMPMVAIVGSRNASAAGVKITQMLTQSLCEAGFAIVSPAVSTPRRIAQASPPAPSPCSPAANRASIHRNMSICSTPSCRTVWG
jgi:DNA processing protein